LRDNAPAGRAALGTEVDDPMFIASTSPIDLPRQST
jgi:hypothetical protein